MSDIENMTHEHGCITLEWTDADGEKHDHSITFHEGASIPVPDVGDLVVTNLDDPPIPRDTKTPHGQGDERHMSLHAFRVLRRTFWYTEGRASRYNPREREAGLVLFCTYLGEYTDELEEQEMQRGSPAEQAIRAFLEQPLNLTTLTEQPHELP